MLNDYTEILADLINYEKVKIYKKHLQKRLKFPRMLYLFEKFGYV